MMVIAFKITAIAIRKCLFQKGFVKLLDYLFPIYWVLMSWADFKSTVGTLVCATWIAAKWITTQNTLHWRHNDHGHTRLVYQD